jgi:GTP-binding protein LepA
MPAAETTLGQRIRGERPHVRTAACAAGAGGAVPAGRCGLPWRHVLEAPSPMAETISHIRNFSIIAHIDHGKSTLADRLLEKTGTVTARESQAQFLDNMDLERERGITIKAQTVRMRYRARDGEEYELNLIDTPGHVDFAYEVSRSLSACEGAILVVDATQGVEAQTLANVYQALDHDLEVVPVINKIDLPSADVPAVRQEIEEVIGLPADDAVPCSAKEGIGIEEILEQIVRKVPPPRGDVAAPLKAIVFDSWYDSYRGVVMLVRVFDGVLRPKQRIRLWFNQKAFEVQELGAFVPFATAVGELSAGEVGFVVANVKDVHDAKVGDTITEEDRPTTEPFPGFKVVKPMVFSGVFPIEAADYENLRDALEKLSLNDSAFTYEAETSQALGFGFRCGYLGLLHMEIVQERLEREYGLSLITTAPSVVYRVTDTQGTVQEIDNPAKLPPIQRIAKLEEPHLTCHVHARTEDVGAILKLCQDRRGIQKDLRYVGTKRVQITYDIPLAEVVFDFFDKLKSVSRGYASLDYELKGYEEADLVKLDILINGEPVDALSVIVHRERAYQRGRDVCQKLREEIPKQMYEVAIQAAIGAKVIARETVKAFRKNVIAKCYGGDISRKRKLLEKQKEGKKRMKQVGSVEIPQSAFLAVLKVEE